LSDFMRGKLMSLFVIYGAIFYLLITLLAFVGGGQPSAFVLGWCVSPVPFLALALWFEHGPRAQAGRGETAWEIFQNVFSLHTQAWSFVIGDIIILPWALAGATDRLNYYGVTLAVVPWWWLIVSGLIGAVAGVAFHRMDAWAYAKEGYAESINSPTKLFHDFVTYPVLFGGVLFVLGALFYREQLSPTVIGILVLLAAWLVLGVADTWRAIQKQKRKMKSAPWGHPPFDLKKGTILVERRMVPEMITHE
jgi:hypothetical protein